MWDCFNNFQQSAEKNMSRKTWNNSKICAKNGREPAGVLQLAYVETLWSPAVKSSQTTTDSVARKRQNVLKAVIM